MNPEIQPALPRRRSQTGAATQRAIPLLLCTLWSALFLCPALLAVPPKVTASVQPSEVRPGGIVSYLMTVEGGMPSAAPPLSLPDGLMLENPSPTFSQQTNIINGVMNQSATLQWQISCTRTGQFTIPSQSITINGVELKTEEVTVVVTDNPAYPVTKNDPMMTLEVGKREFYVGEVVPITVALYIHRNTFPRRVGLIEIPKESFAIQRFPLQGEEGAITMGGVTYRALTYRSTLSALKPGKYKLGPATSEVMIDVPIDDNRMMHPFFNQMETKKMRPSCNDIDVTVLALPTEGVPKGFNNVVGDFEMTLTAEPHEVGLNDPLSVEITIEGTGNFEAITSPSITEPDSWKVYPPRRFNTQSSNNPSDGSPRSISISQVILPRKKVDAVPPFELSFFSPTKKQYVTLRTAPVPITVKAPAPVVEAAPATAASTASSSAAPVIEDEKVPTVKPKITDILAITPPQATWLASRPALWADKRFLTANILVASALGLLILGKLTFAAWRAQVNSPQAPLRKLWKEMQTPHLSRSKFYTLAASYISAQGLISAEAQEVLNQHYTVNYGRSMDEATGQITHEERTRVLKALGAPAAPSSHAPEPGPAVPQS